MLVGCSTEASGPSEPTIRTVRTETVRPLSEVSARSFSGTVRAPLETNLSFRVPGKVTDVLVDVGSRVQEGDLVARLDAEDYRLEMESARASYQQAKAAAQNAKAELRRIKALYANDNASLSAYDRARTRYETASNQADAAKRQLDLARKRLGYTRLTAPASGSIAGTRVEDGENVGVGQPVARLTAGDHLEVQVEVPEGLITSLDVGQSATVTTTALQGRRPATITEVASASNGRRPTYPVVVTLDATAPTLRSGMTARVQFDVGTGKGLVVPPEAVSQDEEGRFVYVVDQGASVPDSLSADGRIARRAVTTGDLRPSGFVVTRGVQPGDQVVTAGMSQLRDGDLVRVSRFFSSEF
jgi:RND family efflux transporter MFP subunit